MALHVTPVTGLSPAMRVVSVRQLAVSKITSGSQAASAATVRASHVTSSFGSLLAYSSAADKPSAEVITAARKRAAASPAAGSATTPAATASTDGSTGLSDFELLFGGSSYDPAATPASSADASTTATGGLSDFELLFGGSSYNPADPMAAAKAAQAAAAAASSAAAGPATPTAQSVFGPNVWMTDPIGLNPDGSTFEYNPIYFATESTAQTVAQMVGGAVITENVFTQPAGDPFVQQQPNFMVQMPNGALINPGLVASFYTFGFPESQIDTMIAQEVANTPAPAPTT